MLSNSLRGIFTLGMAIAILLLGACSANSQVNATTDKISAGLSNPAALTTGSLYQQPVNPTGKLLLSAWLDPDGSDADQYVWDSFVLPSGGTITAINWFGVYDPKKFSSGGPVLDFRVSIYPSNISNTEPAVAGQPLVDYQTRGNAGEKVIGTAGGGTLYAYAFNLPASFTASPAVKYWLQIEAYQHGSIPDWCFASGGDGSHFRRVSGAGGDIMYQTAPGDAAFTLLGPVPGTATPTDISTDTPTSTSTDNATATQTPTDTATSTPINTETATHTPTDTATSTSTPTDTATSTPTDTATASPIPTDTPTSTPTPWLNTPGKVNGGGTIGSDHDKLKATFGFQIQYRQGDMVPRGNLTYQDHTSDLRLKDVSFDLLVIDGNHAWFTGKGEMDDGQVVDFTVEVNDSGQFSITIPALNGYTVGGSLTGGNISIFTR